MTARIFMRSGDHIEIPLVKPGDPLPPGRTFVIELPAEKEGQTWERLAGEVEHG